jgi:trans-aconitate 2-methyltransferase
MNWSAKQYVVFENERTRPVRDLLAAVPGRDVKVAMDIGCGPGNSTEVLAAQFPGASVRGMDSSADMVAAARKRLPNLQFDVSSIETWQDKQPFDLILANAVLQWVPDHAALMPRLIEKLAPGGSLAIQMPDNLEEPAHLRMREVAEQAPWADKLKAASSSRADRKDANWYYECLRPHCSQLDLWRTVYYHQLQGGPAAIVEWFKGSALRPFLAPLDEAEQAAFLERYLAAITPNYPAQADGTVLLPFPRLFIIATR